MEHNNSEFVDIEIKEEPIPYVVAAGLDDSVEVNISDEDDVADDDIMVVDVDKTMKYLRGEISFQDYQHNMHQTMKYMRGDSDETSHIKEEDIEELAASVTVETEKSQGEPRPSTSTATMPMARGKRRITRQPLPPYLQGLMGEANVKLARGEKEEAIAMCMEVIRLAPYAPGPFQTLGMMYETDDDMQKALQFYLIAVHLSPNDPEEWTRLSELSLEQGNLQQAERCIFKAAQYNKSSVESLFTRISLLEQFENVNRRQVTDCCNLIVKRLSKQEPQHIPHYAREVAQKLHEYGETDKAVLCLTQVFSKWPTFATAEDINIYLELLLVKSMYSKVLEVLVVCCSVSLTLSSGKTICNESKVDMQIINTDQVEAVTLPFNLPVDLRAKLAVSLIKLNQISAVHSVVNSLYDETVEDAGDLYLDVAEAFMDKAVYKKAEKLLCQLLKSEDYDKAAIWLRYAECLNFLGKQNQAVMAYRRVVQMAPNHMAARISLSALQQQLGQFDEALDTLDAQSQQQTMVSPEDSLPDIRLMYPKCLLLDSQSKVNEFLKCARQILLGYLAKPKYASEFLKAFTPGYSTRLNYTVLRVVLGKIKAQKHLDFSVKSKQNSSCSDSDLWELFKRVCDLLIKLKRYTELAEFTHLALGSPHFIGDYKTEHNIAFACCNAYILSKNGSPGYGVARDQCLRLISKNRVWDTFARLILVYNGLSHNRFCLRLTSKEPNLLALCLLNGNNALVAGTYNHAVDEYINAYKMAPNDPFHLFMIGITYFALASQKFALKRHFNIIQGCAFLNMYRELRGDCQETFYNIGRALHQTGLLHVAVFYYNRALQCGPALTDDRHNFDLSREIAYNLALIYKKSGSNSLASMVLQKYFVV